MMNAWRQIMIWMDWIIYGVIEVLFQTIIDLSNVEIFSQSVLNDFARRIYIILGLIMVFKIMISFIQILINPEKMNDKEQGVGNILIRVVKALLMIVFVPMLFKTARLAQNYVIPVIPKVILGVTINPSTDGEASETMASVGRVMSFYSFLPFFNYDNTSCDDGSIAGTGTQLGAQTTVPIINNVGDASNHVNDKDCNTTTSKQGYKYNYRWLMSAFVGVYLVYVLVSIAVAIAIRTLKFAICEFAAPIPIASYVDPKTSKQTFDTWVSTTWKVYLDLFIRLIIVYFIVFVFDTIFKPENLNIIYAKLNNDSLRCSLVTLFLIVGLLQFAKSAPKFIGDMLGLKGSGDFMGMFKGEGWKQLAAPAAVGVAGFKGARDSVLASRGNKENASLSALRGIGGFFGASGRMAGNVLSGKSTKEGLKNSVRAVQTKTNDSIKKTRAFAKDGHVGVSSLVKGAYFQHRSNVQAGRGLPTKKGSFDYSIENLESITSAVESAIKDTGGNKVAKYWANRYEAAKNIGLDQFEEQVMASDKQRLSEISGRMSTPGLTKTEELALMEERSKINRRLADKDTIRRKAQSLQAEYVNKAEKDFSDAKTRLLQFALTGDEHSLLAEDIRGSGLKSAQDVYDDGGILARIKSDMVAFQGGLNDKRRDDGRLNEFLGGQDIDFTTMTGSEMKNWRDRANSEAREYKNSPEYFQAKVTDSSSDKK